MRINIKSRALVATLSAAVAFSAVAMQPAAAAAPHKAELAKTHQASDATEFSSQRRHYSHRGYRGGNRAATGAIIGAFGAVAGLAVAESYRRNAYRNDGYYDYGYQEPAYGYAQPYAYRSAPYYAPYGGYAPRNEYFPN